MNRSQLQEVSRLKQKEAAALIKSGCFSGAYYLLGFSIETALKACIAKKVSRFDFPDKEFTSKTHTHDPEQLLRLAGLELQLKAEMQINSSLQLNWAVAKDWKVSSRYETNFSELDVKEFYSACTARKNGILPWIRTRW